MDDLRVRTIVGLKPAGDDWTIGPLISRTDGATFKLQGLIREGVRLQIMDHLQFVLDVSKKQIGGRQRIALLRRQKLFSSERLQRIEGAAVQQRRVLLASEHLD